MASFKVSANDLQIKLGATGVESILQNVAIIIRTRRGTCPMYRGFGLPCSYIGLPAAAARAILYAEIREAIEEYEPRCTVSNINFETDSAGKLIPSVEVTINDN